MLTVQVVGFVCKKQGNEVWEMGGAWWGPQGHVST